MQRPQHPASTCGITVQQSQRLGQLRLNFKQAQYPPDPFYIKRTEEYLHDFLSSARVRQSLLEQGDT